MDGATGVSCEPRNGDGGQPQDHRHRLHGRLYRGAEIDRLLTDSRHGIPRILDPGVLYGHSSTASYQVAGTLEGDEGAIQNLYYWADANGCSGLVPDFETVESDHSIKKFTECENGSQAVLYTLNFSAQPLPQRLRRCRWPL